ncbi:MAG: flavin reductase [Streptosporangiales bacterium]|nr:flavin reductase [Streptosporangiales bacterium]
MAEVVSDDEFRETLARYATGVVVLTAHTDEYGDVGSTVTSFCSVSAEPPLVVASIGTFSRMFDTLDMQPLWAVSVLGAEQRHVAGRFAVPARPGGGVLLTGVAHHRGARTGAFVLDDALAAFECRTTQRVEAGDHTLFVGEVLAVDRLGNGEPLLRFAHGYR